MARGRRRCPACSGLIRCWSRRATWTCSRTPAFATSAWETTYLQLLPGEDPVLEWVRGTGLRPALAALDTADPTGATTAAFESAYAERLRQAYPAGPHGTVFPFRRVFAVAHKP